MKHVGEAIYATSIDPTKKIVILGISNWCTVKNNQLLTKKNVLLLNYLIFFYFSIRYELIVNT